MQLKAARLVGGHRIESKRTRPSKAYATDRTCSECGAVLSRYNPDEVCAAHDPLLRR